MLSELRTTNYLLDLIVDIMRLFVHFRSAGVIINEKLTVRVVDIELALLTLTLSEHS